MSLLPVQTFSNSHTPLWLNVGIDDSSIGKMTLATSVTMPASGASFNAGSISFTKPVNWVRIAGWLNLKGVGATTSATCRLYLSVDGTYSSANSTLVGDLTINTSSGGTNNYVMVDGMTYYSNVEFSSLSLVVVMTSAHTGSVTINISSGAGSVNYTDMPTADPTKWTLSSGGTINFICG